ncbi:hypothetical protein LTR85_006122 [Meristemomyces frigidus]|nr:hypothetical protein LTR85_006122 [Meristemomyces frigidus]
MSLPQAEALLATLATPGTPADAIQAHVQEMTSTEAGRAWLEATARLEQQYKHKAVVGAPTSDTNDGAETSIRLMANHERRSGGANASGGYLANNSASGNFYSIPIPFFAKVGIEVKSDNARREFKVEAKHWWPAIPGFQAGTLYYNDINELQGEAAAFVGAAGPYFSVTFSAENEAIAWGNKNYATFQAANIGLPNLPDGFTLYGGKWESW